MAWSTGYTSVNVTFGILGSNIYVGGDSGAIYKTDLATGTILDSNWCFLPPTSSTRTIATSSNTIYAGIVDSPDPPSIYTIDLGAETAEFFSSSIVNSNINLSIFGPGSAVDGGNLYVVNATSSNILRINLSNSTDFDDAWVVDSLITSPYSICINNGFMYVTSFGYISKINMTTKDISVLSNVSGLNITGIATDGNILYLQNTTESRIETMSFTGTMLNSNFASVPYADGQIIINGSYLYAGGYTGNNEVGIYRFSTTTPAPVICFKDGTLILTDKGYVPIEELRKGDLVKTLLDGYKPIYLIGKKEIYHPATTERGKDQLYIGTQAEIPWLKEDLIVTGSHCILVDDFKAGEKEETIEVLGKVYATDKKYRLPACVDKRFAVYKPEGNYTVYHLALEHDNRVMNYGIYANGLLVETCSKRCMDEYGKLEVIA